MRANRASIEAARGLFASHTAVKQDGNGLGRGLGRWLLQQHYPDGAAKSDLWTEIIEGAGGYLLVGGDIEFARFGICGRTSWAGQMVRWMGNRSAPDSYMAEKLRIGMQSRGFDPATSWDDVAACEDMAAYVADDADEISSLTKDVIADAIGKCQRGDFDSQHDLCRCLYDGGIDPEVFGGWGLVQSTRLVNAWAALNRLVQILNEKDAQ